MSATSSVGRGLVSGEALSRHDGHGEGEGGAIAVRFRRIDRVHPCLHEGIRGVSSEADGSEAPAVVRERRYRPSRGNLSFGDYQSRLWTDSPQKIDSGSVPHPWTSGFAAPVAPRNAPIRSRRPLAASALRVGPRRGRAKKTPPRRRPAPAAEAPAEGAGTPGARGGGERARCYSTVKHRRTTALTRRTTTSTARRRCGSARSAGSAQSARAR